MLLDWKPLWLALLLAGSTVVVRVLIRPLQRQLRVWYAWSFLPHTQVPWVPGGDLAESTSLTRHRFYALWTKLCGGVFRLRFGPLPVVMLTDPQAARPIFEEAKASIYTPIQGLFSQNEPSLFTLPPPEYYRSIRKAVAPAFNSSNLKQGFDRLANLMPAVLKHIRSVGPNGNVDVFNMAGHVTMDAISLAVFNDDLGGSEKLAQGIKPDYAELMDPAMKGAVDTLAIPWIRRLTFIPAMGKLQQDFKKLHAEHKRMVARLRTCNPPASSLGGHLLALKDPATGQPLTDAQLEAELITFFFAGYDTSTAAISWALGLIAAHPAVQEKLTAELEGIGLKATAQQPQPRRVTWEDLGHLNYLRNVIKESLRMFTVAAGGTNRTLSKPTRIGAYDLAAGTTVQVAFHGIHRNPSVWDRPDEFLPERFDEPDAEYVQPHLSQDPQSEPAPASQANGVKGDEGGKTRRFMPFSYGMRSCVGQNLANLTMMTFVATICANFHLKLAPEIGDKQGVEDAAITLLTMQPKDGMLVRCSPWA